MSKRPRSKGGGPKDSCMHFQFMAGARENLNLKFETREFMDQPSDHVVTILPAPDASSIASSSVAVGFQTLNSPSREDVSSSSANTPDRSPTPRRRRRRSQWKNPCFQWSIGSCCRSIEIILLVVFLSHFRDEHPHVALRVWAIGYGAGCLAELVLSYWRYKHLPEIWSFLPQTFLILLEISEVDDSQTGRHQRFGKILEWLTTSLDCLFMLRFVVGIGIVDTRWASREAPLLKRLCIVFLVLTYFRYILPLTMYLVKQWIGVRIVRLAVRPRGANADVISALPTYKFHAQVSDHPEMNQANKDGHMGDSIGGEGRIGALPAEVAECCICLDPYRHGVELKELPCAHHFHVTCIDRWLKINASCPICKGDVGTPIRVFDMEPPFITVTV